MWYIPCRALLKSLKPLFDPSNLPLLVFVNKGIETGTNRLPLEIIAENCGKEVARASTFLVSRTGFPSLSDPFSDAVSESDQCSDSA